MSHKLHVQKQSPATDVESHQVFKPGHFDVQTKLDADSQPEQEAVDLPTQLSRAKRFGHNLNQVPVNQSIQRQAIDLEEHVQRDVVEEEKKRMKKLVTCKDRNYCFLPRLGELDGMVTL